MLIQILKGSNLELDGSWCSNLSNFFSLYFMYLLSHVQITTNSTMSNTNFSLLRRDATRWKDAFLFPCLGLDLGLLLLVFFRKSIQFWNNFCNQSIMLQKKLFMLAKDCFSILWGDYVVSNRQCGAPKWYDSDTASILECKWFLYGFEKKKRRQYVPIRDVFVRR